MTTSAELANAAPVYVHPHALVESEHIGQGTRVWAFAHIMPQARVGSHCNICDHAFIESGAIVGDNVTVKNGVAIWDCVTVEDGVFLGPNCVLTNDLAPRTSRRKSREELLETRICAHATIGANATVVCGVRVGRGAFIGAGTVVIRSVPDFALVVGNPARHIGWMCLCATRLALPAVTPLGSHARCDSCKRTYVRTAEGLAMLASSATHPEEEPLCVL